MALSARIEYLIGGAFNKTATAEELEELLLALQSDHNGLIVNAMESYSRVGNMDDANQAFSYLSGSRMNAMVDNILQTDVSVADSPVSPQASHENAVGRRPGALFPVFRYVAAACSILLILTLIFRKNKHEADPANDLSARSQLKPSNAPIDFSPGKNKATLQLEDGSTILLDSTAPGPIARQGGTTILKGGNGEIYYRSTGNIKAKGVYNTLRTPRGGQYQLVLPDGSKAWLNAASSISYPVSFSDQERKVATTGEVYFEIAPDARKPFVVDIGDDMHIRVLGTHFNVNAYPEEKWERTTLLEGSVKIFTGATAAQLKPGQQARANHAGGLEIADNIDGEAVTAWKNGLFNFHQATIRDIMNQLSRWYDIEVRYEGILTDQVYKGEMQRDLTLSQVLKLLEISGIHLSIKDRTLIVTP